MDRKLLIHSKKGYLIAEFTFSYDGRNQVSGSFTEFGHYEIEEGLYSAFPLSLMPLWPEYKKFRSVEEIKAHDIKLATDHVGQGKDINDFIYSYEEDQVSRFVLSNHREVFGIVTIRFNFPQNIKELDFVSGLGIGEDEKISSDSLEGNYDLIMRINDSRIRYADMHAVAERNPPPYEG